MSEPRTSGPTRTIAALAGLGLACGVLCAGLLYWWWSALPVSDIVVAGSYTPIPGVPISDPDNPPPFGLSDWRRDDARPDVQPWHYLALVGAPTLLGLLAGISAAGTGWRLARR